MPEQERKDRMNPAVNPMAESFLDHWAPRVRSEMNQPGLRGPESGSV
jgi:hypothetical protein